MLSFSVRSVRAGLGLGGGVWVWWWFRLGEEQFAVVGEVEVDFVASECAQLLVLLLFGVFPSAFDVGEVG